MAPLPRRSTGRRHSREAKGDRRLLSKPWSCISQLRKAKAMFQEMDMDYWLAKTEKALEKLKER